MRFLSREYNRLSQQPFCYNNNVKIKLLTLLFILSFILISPRLVLSNYKEEPRRITIPAVGINLPVKKAKIVSETWEVLNDAASYGELTTFPGEIGNTVIFSHAVSSLFGDLPKIRNGDFVYILTDSYTFTYKIVKTNSVQPDDIGILASGNEKALTLYTCEGTADERRFTAKAVLIDISKACRFDPLLTRNL